MNVPMDFDLKLEPNGSFGILTSHKDVTLLSVIARQRAMRKFAEKHGVYHFLLDTRGMSFCGTYVDLFRFARKILHKEGFDSTWKVALVTSPKDRSHDMLEIFTHNAGYQVKIFTDYNEAQVWLTWKSDV
jgi:hypothetical protein